MTFSYQSSFVATSNAIIIVRFFSLPRTYQCYTHILQGLLPCQADRQKYFHLRMENNILVYANCLRNSRRNRVIVLLSTKAGMRAGEIANLTWDMVVEPAGQIGGIIELRDHAAKKGRGRVIPMHPGLRAALADLHRTAADSGSRCYV